MTTTAYGRTRASSRPAETAAIPPGSTPVAQHAPPSRGRLTRLVRGADDDPNWARPGLLALLTLATVVFCWDLTNSGYANEFYAAAVKSGTQDWKAWFFGSLDSSNAITVDKPPASLWIMGLSARLFGFSSFSLLLPQALMGIATVWLTHATVRRWSGHAAGLVAGLLVTLTPVAALMFRFDNPDAMLVLLMTAAAYAVTRALGDTRRELSSRAAARWMVAAGLLIGFAFLTKMLQGLLVLPGLGLAYLVAARYSLGKRILHLLLASVGVVVGAGWLVVVEALWPAASRPYIGGSTNNSLWDLAIGYNGLGRILGGSGNGGGGGGMGGGGGFGGTTGILRMFNSQFGGEISWLLPASLILLVAGLVARGRAPRTDGVRAGLALWGGWLVVTALCLSFMEGTVHSYYSVALAPAIAACTAIGAREAWVRRDRLVWRCVLAVSLCVTAVWSFRVLSTTASDWLPWLRWTTVVVTVLGAMLLVAAPAWNGARARRLAASGLIVATIGALGGTSAWTFATVAQGHNGSMPAAGPVAAGGMGGGGAHGGGMPGGSQTGGSTTGGSAPQGSGPAEGTAPNGGSKPTGSAPQGSGAQASQGSAPASGTGEGSAPSGSGQSGTGQSSAGMSTTTLTTMLDATTSRWSAAVIGDQSAATYILSSHTAVMSIGGWSGSDDNVTLAQFQHYVANGDIHYFIAGGGMGGGPSGNSGSGAQITAWVKAHYTATTINGVTVYDLTKAKSS